MFLDYSAIVLEQALHVYYMDYLKPDHWHGTVITKRKNLSTPQMLRDVGHHTNKFPYIPNSGHHFSWMGGIERTLKKRAAVVEGDVSIENDAERREKVKESTLKAMREGIWGKDKMLHYDISTIKLPYITEFVKKYPYFLREYDFGKDDV